ncbi:hypothetical protein RRG08_058395 [Elysia crispata]|uniref:ABC-2 type transporter transmembrane domain-containing protein n=1 Tax=Elysia crispata TaxID=231223 RepID=A0AAE0XW95_9GAST|nr:hypothetical protein RRG08_058395 [Elysia crispata]
MSICRHLRLLLWKNMKIKVRQPVTLAAELLVPLLCALLLVILRSNVKVKIVDDPVVYRPAEMNFPDYFYQAHSLIFYSPATNSTSLLMDLFKKTFMKEFKGMGLLRMRAFPSGVEDIPRRMKSESASLLIEFRDMNGEALDGQAIPANIQYILHPRVEAFHLHTAETYPYPPYNWPPCGDDDPLGLSGVQYIMGLSLARYWTVQEKRDPWMKTFGLQTQCLPFPPYEEDPMVMILITTYSSYLITSFLISAVMFTKAIVFEKEFKLKETLKLVGVNHSIYWISWLISFSLYFVPVLAGYTVLMTVAFTPDSWPVMGKVDPSLFFAFLLCYGLAIITFSFMVSTFVDKGESKRLR